MHLYSNSNRTVSKWHIEINYIQEELNRQILKYDILCQKGYIRSIMSIKKMQDEIVREKSGVVKPKEESVKYDDIQFHLEANISKD